MRVLAEILVEAGAHRRRNTPVSTVVGRRISTERLSLIDQAGNLIPAQFRQISEGIEASWILEDLEPLGSRRFTLVEQGGTGGYEVTQLQPKLAKGQITILHGKDIVMSCHYSREFSKPFVHPLTGPSGSPLTWNGPQDHMHHRSLWVAHGQVNENDLWSEQPGHGNIAAADEPSVVSGPAYSEVRLLLSWQSMAGDGLLDEERTLRLWNLSDKHWLLDHSSLLSATYGDVSLGDTKEGGTLCVRVRESMEVENGGKIENCWGGVNEAETWGRKANWCDYSGPVEGAWQGIAVFDHPSNPRHPTYWHVRDYGLMTANVLGVTAFNGREDEKGGMSLGRGERLAFRYRVYVHNGDALAGDVAGKYIDYVSPSRISLVLK